jgi:hypothetical protein
MVTNLLSYIASELPDGTYAWRVRAINSVNAAGAWSSTRTLTLDTTPPAAPLVTAPVDGTSMTNTRFNLAWNKVTDAVRYEVQIDLDPDFPLPPSDVGNVTNYKPVTPLARGLYSWHVRAIDKAGNASGWSSPARTFEIVAGVTALTPTPTLEVTPTIVPEEPTAFPTATPPVTAEPTVLPPDPSVSTVESDDPVVVQTGTWTAHNTPYASGGRYLYSSGSPEDALTLSFSGTRLDVIYVQHPALGVFVIEIDGVPVQLVDSSAADAEFGARASVLVSAGEHTLRVYPLSGTIAIDAFGIEPVVVEPTTEPTLPPVETVVAPTVEPTTEPTLPPVEPTVAPTPIPTSVPLPVVLPLVETFDSGLGWTADGVWTFDTQAAHAGAGWWADSTLRGQISTLTYDGLIDLRTAQYPQMSFWQKGILSAADVLSLEVSLDGGVLWWPALRQSALAADWTWQTVDLSAYWGNVIALRFVLNTVEGLPQDAVTAGFGLDDLIIQEVPPTPTIEPTLVPTGLPTTEPTSEPTIVPTELPTAEPTPVPTEVERTTT